MATAVKENIDKFTITKDGEVVDVDNSNNNCCDNINNNDDNDDDEELPLPICTDEELAKKCQARDDIFRVHRNRGVKYVTLVFLALAIALGVYIESFHVLKNGWSFIGGGLPINGWGWNRPNHPDFYVRGDDPSGNGGGSPSARVTYKHAVAIVTDRITGYTVDYDGTAGVGGYAKDMDGLLSGISGIRGDGGSNSGLKDAAGIGLGKGINSGFGGEGIRNIGNKNYMTPPMPSADKWVEPDSAVTSATSDSTVTPAASSHTAAADSKPEEPSPDEQSTEAKRPTNGRDRGDIQRVIVGNAPAVRGAYNARLREAPGLTGNVSVKFAIDEHGKVISAQVMESTMNDAVFETTLVNMIGKWDFGKIDKQGDVTEVTYPFMFSQ